MPPRFDLLTHSFTRSFTHSFRRSFGRSFRRRVGVLLLLPCLGFLAAADKPKIADPSGRPPTNSDAWFVVQMQGQKCGYMHAVSKRVDDEVRSQSTMMIEIARGRTKIKMNLDQKFVESLDGEPRAFEQSTALGEIPVVYTGVVKDGRVTIVTEQMGQKKKDTFDFDPEIRFAYGLLIQQYRHGFKPGVKYTAKTYEPSVRFDAPLPVEVEVLGPETIDVLGKGRLLTRIKTTMKIEKMNPPMEIVAHSWVDETGLPIVTDMPLGALQFRLLHATKEEALGGNLAPELFLNTFVQVDRRISPKAKQIKLRLRLPDDGGMKLPELPDTDMQKFDRKSPREAVLTIKRIDWDSLRKAPEPKTAPAGMEEFLRASSTIDTKDSRIRRLARRAVKNAKTPAEKADALRNFVTRYVKNKGMDVGFATASEVARNRSGDCTEHGVLLVALARAAGLPARAVSGIVQIPGDSTDPGQFGYHMWAEVFIDGRWVDIDAALRQTDCDPTHIAVSLLPLNNEGVAESAFGILPLLGRLEIEVLDEKK